MSAWICIPSRYANHELRLGLMVRYTVPVDIMMRDHMQSSVVHVRYRWGSLKLHAIGGPSSLGTRTGGSGGSVYKVAI